jgi:hypothetical protein
VWHGKIKTANNSHFTTEMKILEETALELYTGNIYIEESIYSMIVSDI